MNSSPWFREHPDTYDVRIATTLSRIGLTDVSWHNDLSASFEVDEVRLLHGETCSLRVWIMPELARDRENPDLPRFQVDFHNDGDEVAPTRNFDDPLSMLYVIVCLLQESDRLHIEDVAKAMAKAANDKPFVLPPQSAIDKLVAEYQWFNQCINKENGIAIQLGSAEEHYFDEQLTKGQRDWLQDFGARWEQAAADDRDVHTAAKEVIDWPKYGGRDFGDT